MFLAMKYFSVIYASVQYICRSYITFYSVATYLLLCAKLPHLWCKLAQVQL